MIVTVDPPRTPTALHHLVKIPKVQVQRCMSIYIKNHTWLKGVQMEYMVTDQMEITLCSRIRIEKEHRHWKGIGHKSPNIHPNM
jgi:hypothetical protein